MGDVVRDVVAAIGARDRNALTAALHPYLHWTRTDGRTIRGRSNVLAYLETAAPTEPPFDYELRDGQIYRWVEQGTPR